MSPNFCSPAYVLFQSRKPSDTFSPVGRRALIFRTRLDNLLPEKTKAAQFRQNRQPGKKAVCFDSRSHKSLFVFGA